MCCVTLVTPCTVTDVLGSSYWGKHERTPPSELNGSIFDICIYIRTSICARVRSAYEQYVRDLTTRVDLDTYSSVIQNSSV